MKPSHILIISSLLASPALAAPKAKVVYSVAFVQAGHLIHYDARLTVKAALEVAGEMDRLKQDSGAHHFVIAVEASE